MSATRRLAAILRRRVPLDGRGRNADGVGGKRSFVASRRGCRLHPDAMPLVVELGPSFLAVAGLSRQKRAAPAQR